MAGTSILENNLAIILKLKINTSHSTAVPNLVCALDSSSGSQRALCQPLGSLGTISSGLPGQYYFHNKTKVWLPFFTELTFALMVLKKRQGKLQLCKSRQWCHPRLVSLCSSPPSALSWKTQTQFLMCMSPHWWRSKNY